jgi:N4-gp56 family major capsid protein
MGTSENSVVQVIEDLTAKAGTQITASLVTRISGDGVTNDATLEGNEAVLSNYGHNVTVNQLRQGVVVGEYEKSKTKINIPKAAKVMLKLWNMEKLRDLKLARFLSPVIGGLTTYAAATEAQKDAWQVANNPTTSNQRILFGAAKSNASGDHSVDLANIDGTADDLHQDIVRLVRRMAQSCAPAIRPIMVPGGKDSAGGERFYGLAGSLAFRDLQANMDTVLQNADSRGDSNKIFAGGKLTIGAVTVFEIPEMDKTPTNGGCLLENVGNGGTVEVEPFFLCGAQALLLAIANRMEVRTEEFDYSNKMGVAVTCVRGCEKTTYNSFQHGLATAYVSAVGD